MLEDNDTVHRVWMLLDIIHKATSAGPAYLVWATAATSELNRIRTDLTIPEPEPELPLGVVSTTPVKFKV